jgi:hypothetical protein
VKQFIEREKEFHMISVSPNLTVGRSLADLLFEDVASGLICKKAIWNVKRAINFKLP